MVSVNPPTPTPTPTSAGTFAPTGLQNPARYSWSSAAPYNNADITSPSAESLWSGSTPKAKQNPAFLSMTSGQLMDDLNTGGPNGRPARLLRGFIRRTYSDPNDPNADCRLNFMFNPPEIHRDYVSYLDQGALDPFNTIYQSGNLVAPPSILNFSFELFFDRQNEAQDPNNPGTFVDQEFFDKVVRGVRDSNVGPSPTGMPDNGLMLGGAQDVTVVFSPELAVSGRPINASVAYVKFTHRMVPTRMVINLQIRAVRIGPVSDRTESYSSAHGFGNTEAVAAFARVVPAEVADPVVKLTRSDLAYGSTDKDLNTYVIKVAGMVNGASGQGNGSAVDYAKAQVAKFNTAYDANGGRMNLWKSADCSSLVWGGHAGAGTAASLGWPAWNGTGSAPDAPSSYGMWTGLKDSTKAQKIWGFSGTPDISSGIPLMQKGDLVFRIKGDGSVLGENHVAFIDSVSGGTATTFAAKGAHASPQCGSGTFSAGNNGSNFNYCIRPLVMGGDASVNANNTHASETGSAVDLLTRFF